MRRVRRSLFPPVRPHCLLPERKPPPPITPPYPEAAIHTLDRPRRLLQSPSPTCPAPRAGCRRGLWLRIGLGRRLQPSRRRVALPQAWHVGHRRYTTARGQAALTHYSPAFIESTIAIQTDSRRTHRDLRHAFDASLCTRQGQESVKSQPGALLRLPNVNHVHRLGGHRKRATAIECATGGRPALEVATTRPRRPLLSCSHLNGDD